MAPLVQSWERLVALASISGNFASKRCLIGMGTNRDGCLRYIEQ